MANPKTSEPLPKEIHFGKERYPARAYSEELAPKADSKAIKNTALHQAIQRKSVSSKTASRPSTSANVHSKSVVSNSNSSRANKSADSIYHENALLRRSSSRLSELSAGAAAVEKSLQESNTSTNPRPTRTSSLRARISAGSLISDCPSTNAKVVGFTDFTTIKEDPLKMGRGEVHQSVPKRDPAKFIAGSRRSMVHRPSSRASIRSDYRASSPSFDISKPSRLPPPVPTTKKQSTDNIKDPFNSEASNSAMHRRSSIPVFRHAVVNLLEATSDDNVPEPPTQSTTKSYNNDFKIFEDDFKRNPGVEENVNLTRGGTVQTAPSIANTNGSTNSATREILKPSRHVKTKRLSLTYPEHGPTLRISPSADRLIMGEDYDKENRPELSKNDTKGLHRGAVNRELHHASRSVAPNSRGKTQLARPLSGLGLPLSGSRDPLRSKEKRARKARSAEFSVPVVGNLQCSSQSKALGNGVPHNSSLIDDPFVDTDSQSRGNEEKPNDNGEGTDQALDPKDPVVKEDSWISPLPEKRSSLQATDSTPTNPVQSSSSRRRYSGSSLHLEDAELEPGKGGNEQVHISFNNEFPHSQPLATPDHSTKDEAKSSGSFPPRCSSRATVPDLTIGGSSKSSPNPEIVTDNRFSKDFLSKQSKAGASIGRSPLIENSNSQAVKRESIARESNKSNNSLSKKAFSNIRGLFHKRFSEASESSPFMNSNKKGKQKVNIASNGSPFPQATDSHSIHRPTFASKNRSVVTAISHRLGDIAPTPTVNSPMPSEISRTTTLAMQILESARKERSNPKKERLLELGKILVEAITQARDAEKAMEEAKQASRKAEVAYALCKGSVADVARCVEEWKNEVDTV